MSISQPFILRPIATSLLMLGIFVFGIASYNLLPVAALPNVDFPTITVTAQFPGASPETMASSVATPLEQQFGAIPGLDQMTSTSGLGATAITLRPRIVVAEGNAVERVLRIVDKAHETCYIANSLTSEITIEPHVELAAPRLTG